MPSHTCSRFVFAILLILPTLAVAEIQITPEPGFDIVEVGGEGAFFNSPVPDNMARASAGASYFGSSELGGFYHTIYHINDGRYGNSYSWIPDGTDPSPFVGVEFDDMRSIGSVAWSRDNNNNNDPVAPPEGACAGECTDRWAGTYFIELSVDTGVAQDPNAATWTLVGSVAYSHPSNGALMWRRHRFNLSQGGQPISARALRIRTDAAAGQCIDELEIQGTCPGDADNDGACDDLDRCPGFDDNSPDTDLDDVPDLCDACPGFDDLADADGDGVPDDCDLCPGLNDNTPDSDGDGVPDACDLCAGFDDYADADGDGVPNDCDPCPNDFPDDSDGDGICDSDDACFGDNATGDSDGDTVCDDSDVCPGLDDRTECMPPANVICVSASAPGANNGTDWFNAYNHLQSALAAATAGQEIWVAAGTYMPDGGFMTTSGVFTQGNGVQSERFMLKNDVGLYGGFAGTETQRIQRDPAANVTILSGDLANNDGPDFANYGENCWQVVNAIGISTTGPLDGFTITGGSSIGRGSGLVIQTSESAVVNNCIVIANQADAGAGAVYLDRSDCVFTDCVFMDNRTTTQHGGGVYADPNVNGVSFIRCDFINNQTLAENSVGGGLYLWGGSHLPSVHCEIIDCRFLGNSATFYGGGAYINGFNLTMTNCLFSGNNSVGPNARGGGLALYATLANGTTLDDVRVTNCTFADNFATAIGGGIVTGRNPKLTNVIVWGNSAAADPQIRNDSAIFGDPGADIKFCNIQGSNGSGGSWNAGLGFDAGNNIDADPQFIDADGPDDIAGTEDDDLRIPSGSPCVDAGDNTAPGLAGLIVDLMGRPRFVDDPATPDTGTGTPPMVDLGAHECQIPTPPGDMNCDGVVDFDDVTPFVQALLDPAAYAASFPACDIGNADMNGDTFENGDDLQLFLEASTGP